ncbi:hypothetical protein AB0M45_31430 [Nocardia sp. NPDC051787]|uniref:hypothetical protein n=1 Tax=Nocardia sp. NPDC051787 TaxID=3155415 RepID=UPI00343C6CDD
MSPVIEVAQSWANTPPLSRAPRRKSRNLSGALVATVDSTVIYAGGGSSLGGLLSRSEQTTSIGARRKHHNCCWCAQSGLGPPTGTARSAPVPLSGNHNLSTKPGAIHLRRWLDWLSSHGVKDLAEVDQHHCDAFLQWSHHVRDHDGNVVRSTSPRYRHNILTPVKELAAYTELFTTGGYRPGFQPWPRRAIHQVVGRTHRGENSTPPVRQEVLQPLLAAAFYVTEELAPHVLALRDTERRREIEWEHRFEEHHGADGQWSAVSELVSRYMSAGEPLPQTSDEQVRKRIARGWDRNDPLLLVSTKRLALEAGIRHPLGLKIPADRRTELIAAVQQVGVQHPTARHAAHVPRADGNSSVPWTLPLPGHTRVSSLVERLRTACLVVVASVTGMRMSEIVELPFDCRLPPTRVAEDLVRYRIKSKRIKGQPHGGTWDEWVVVEQVHHALGLLRQARTTGTGTHLLDQGKIDFGQRLTLFRDWVNSDDGRRLHLSPIPADPVNLKMLRRTLALELARRPGGLLAAKVHLKHISVATTEGHALAVPRPIFSPRSPKRNNNATSNSRCKHSPTTATAFVRLDPAA